MSGISIILGTRPEIIKMSPVIRECKRLGLSFFILHTGQHYSYNMDKAFFEQLNLPQPTYNLAVGSGTQAEETGKMMIGIENVLRAEKPKVVLIEGDTNTVLAGAIAASKLLIRVGHVEAGLRSYDRTMPEEINRILTDHVSDYLFTPTQQAKRNLLSEGISKEKIFVTGNTIVDAVQQNLDLANKTTILENLGLSKDNYILFTLHRQENVDNEAKLEEILRGLKLVDDALSKPIIWPIHPRASKRIEEYGLQLGEWIIVVPPLDYLRFLKLESQASLVLTDSGGVQEEACLLRVPCVTLRENTERPETLEIGSNALAGFRPEIILEKSLSMIRAERDWQNPYGDGRAAERIIQILTETLHLKHIMHGVGS